MFALASTFGDYPSEYEFESAIRETGFAAVQKR